MTFEEFACLKEVDKTLMVQQKGVQISDRFEPEFFIALY
jgi:hypothetical protein